MRNKQNVKLAAVFVCMVMIGCASRGAVKPVEQAAPGGIDEIMKINWFLIEFKTAGTIINLNRPQLEAEEMGDVFSIQFDIQFENEHRAFGKGAANRYNAPCQWGDGNTISIGSAATTRMMALKELELFKEQDFFNYLSQVNRWAINAHGQLELSTPNGAVLTFEKK
ncbi:MAG: META domain-containing protein [Treponema sp.]|jgi:heat shock protein HslJ|nr:META domain-containing protein [Treponema sp.]